MDERTIVAIVILIVDLISANPIELFSNRTQANTNLSGTERSIIKLNVGVNLLDCVLYTQFLYFVQSNFNHS